MPGSQLLRLLDESQRVAGGAFGKERFLHLMCAVADDNYYIDGNAVGGIANGIQDMRQHRTAGDGVEHLRQGFCTRGAHPLTLSCREYDDVHARLCTLM